MNLEITIKEIGLDRQLADVAITNLQTLTQSQQADIATFLLNQIDKVSTEQLSDALINLKNELMGGAGTAYDSFIELAQLIQSDKTTIEALTALAASKVSFDTAQSLTAEQRLRALQNIGAVSTADMLAAINSTITGLGITPANYTGHALIIYDGNSLWAGRGSSHEINSPTDFSPGPFPTTTRNVLAAKYPAATFDSRNFGVSGQRTPWMIDDVVQQSFSLFDPSVYDRHVYIVGEITNHMADGGASVQEAYNSYVSLCTMARKAGLLVISTTVLPRTTNLSISPAEFASRANAVNALIRRNFLSFSDALADIAKLSLNYPDGTHTDDAGYVAIGNLLAEKAAPLLVLGYNPQSLPYLLSGTTLNANAPGPAAPPPSPTPAPASPTPAPTSPSPAAPSPSPTPAPAPVPASPTPTPATSNVVLSLAGQGNDGSTSFVDGAGHLVLAKGNAKHSTLQKKFGISSIYLDGTEGTYLQIPTSADFDFGGADFTMEMWLFKTGAGSGYPALFTRGDNDANQWTWCFPNTGARTELYIWNGNYTAQNLNPSADVPLNTWVHLALVSQGGIRSAYQGGQLVGTAQGTLSMETNPVNKPICVGYLPIHNDVGGDSLPAYLHARVTRQALYTGQTIVPAQSW